MGRAKKRAEAPAPRTYVQTPLGEDLFGRVTEVSERMGMTRPELLFHAVTYNIAQSASDLSAGRLAGVCDLMSGPPDWRVRSLMNDHRTAVLTALGSLAFAQGVTYPRGRLIAAAVRRWMAETDDGTKRPPKPALTHAAGMLLALLLAAKHRRERELRIIDEKGLLPGRQRVADATVATAKRKPVSLEDAAKELDAADLALYSPEPPSILLRTIVY